MPDRAPSLHPDALLAQAGWVRAVARALVLDADRVDEVVQQTWLAALERPATRVGSARGWLAGIVRNVVRQERRSASRRAAREREARGPEPLPPVAELVERADLQKRVVQAVLELEEPYRSTLLWRYFEELSAEEIARRLGVPASTVRSRLSAALDALRARFDRERGGDRRAWSLALMPLVLPRGTPGAALVSTSSTGVPAMILGASTVSALVVAAAIGIPYASKALRSAPPAPALAAPTRTPTLVGGGALAPVPALQESQRRALPTEPPPSAVKGRVLDLEGAPVAGLRVFVGGQPSPFAPVEAGLRLQIGRGEERRAAKGEPGEDYQELPVAEPDLAEWAAIDPQRLAKHGTVLGKTLVTDAEGRFAAPLAAGARVYVTLAPELGFESTARGAWHAAPADGLELRVRRLPIAELSIWVTDLTTGRKIAFAGRLSSAERVLADWKAGAEVVHQRVALAPGAPGLFRVEVTAPEWARTSREFRAVRGGENPVELRVQSGAGLPGEVVDALGNPLAGALVFWGDALDLRAGSLFRAYQPERVVGGVRTDAAGRFTLPGTAARVAAWHPEHGAVDVAASAAARLVLPARGGLRGRVLDERGQPAADRKVTLDGARETLTDAEGAYAFEGVEPGVHGVGYWPERFVGVVVVPGETTEIPPEEPIQPGGELTSGGAPFTARDGGVILGLGRVFSVSEWGNEEGRLQAGSVRAGRHLLMSPAGFLSLLDVQPQAPARIELGTARVVIETPILDDPLVCLLPEEASRHPAARYWGRYFYEKHASERIVYAPLPAGRYALLVEGRETPLLLSVAEGQELVIPREQWLGSGTER